MSAPATPTTPASRALAAAPDLSVRLGGLTLRSPAMLASGTCGYGAEYAGLIDYARIGALVTKGLSVRPRLGNPTPRVAEVEGGLLNAIGLENVGLDGFLRDKAPFCATMACPVVANVFGSSAEEFGALAAGLDPCDAVAAIEVNISCPNVKAGGASFAQSPQLAAEATAAVRRATRKPVFVKLSPAVADVTEIARACVDAGADALCVANTLPAMSIDVRTRRPRLANGSGGLSGAALRPVAVHLTHRVARAVAVPVIGIGGIFEWEHAAEFLLAGASAVQVGTANFVDPSTAERVHAGLAAWMAAEGFSDVAAVRAALR